MWVCVGVWVGGRGGGCVGACVRAFGWVGGCAGVHVHTHIYHKVLLLIIIFGTHFIMVSNRTDIPKKDSLLAFIIKRELKH